MKSHKSTKPSLNPAELIQANALIKIFMDFAIDSGAPNDAKTKLSDISKQLKDASTDVLDYILLRDYSDLHPYDKNYDYSGIEIISAYLDESIFNLFLTKASASALEQSFVLGSDYILSNIAHNSKNRNYLQIIDSIPLSSFMTKILKNGITKNEYEDNDEEINVIYRTKLPFIGMFINWPNAIDDSNINKFYNFINSDEILNLKQLSLTDCHQWLNSLEQMHSAANDEKTKNQINAMSMHISLIASGKEPDPIKKNTLKKQAVDHAMQISSPHALSIEDNNQVFEFYQMKSQEMHGLDFLKQAALDCINENRTDHSSYILFTAKMASIDKKLNEDWSNRLKDSIFEDTTQSHLNSKLEIEALYPIYKTYYSLNVYLDTLANSLSELSLASSNEDMQTRKRIDNLTNSLSKTILQAKISLDGIKDVEIDDKEKIINSVLANLKTSFDEKNLTLEKLKVNKSLLPILKNLIVCLATIPLFGAGFVYAGVWAKHYSKHKEHLLFNSKTAKKTKSIQQTSQHLKNLAHKK